MFGHNDDNQAVAAQPAAQSPSMLDNVSQQDFQSTDTPTSSAPPASDPITIQSPINDITQSTAAPVETPAQEPVHELSTDNPFLQDSVSSSPVTTPPATADPSPSGPVTPPAVLLQDDDDAQDQSGYMAAIADDETQATSPVDHDKLADMKQQALAHLEPLTDHLGGTPEEVFKTTMMMIQANDNHTLLEKALEAAKNIEDDKARAQAMLDVINEINYFSQTSE